MSTRRCTEERISKKKEQDIILEPFKFLSCRDTRFWSKVQPATLGKILLRYRYDFELFGYSAATYFEKIKVKVDIDKVLKGSKV